MVGGTRKRFNKPRGSRPRSTRKGKKAAAISRSLTPYQKLEVRRIVKRNPETKMAVWYNGTQLWTGSGASSQQSFVLQNQSILSNAADIQRLIPLVFQGTGDSQRIGEHIQPVSLQVHGTLKLASNSVIIPSFPTDIRVVIYVLQHVALKTYQSLRTQYDNTVPTPNVIGGNDFTQLLVTGEGTTKAFQGRNYDKFLPVASQYYKLLEKKVVTLRYTGASVIPSTATPLTTQTTVATDINNWNANYSFNLTKHLPKILRYQETTVTTGYPNDPTNSSIFMAMGYERFDGNTPDPVADNTFLEQQYVSILKFKDP